MFVQPRPRPGSNIRENKTVMRSIGLQNNAARLKQSSQDLIKFGPAENTTIKQNNQISKIQ